MQKLIQTLRNIAKIEELRKRILYTLGILVIYRLGAYVVLPGIDPNQLAALQKQSSALHFGIHCDSIDGYDCALLPETTEGR